MRPVAAVSCSAAVVRFSCLRLTIATSAPCRAKASAIPLPIPVAPPVINATLPRKRSLLKILMSNLYHPARDKKPVASESIVP